MLSIPDVTLVAVETQVHELAEAAILDCLSKATFGNVIVFTDDPTKIKIPGAEYHTVPNWPTKIEQGSFYYSEAASHIKTSHALMIEWDAGIRDVSSWRDDFLQYDMIGAPWVWAKNNRREHSVGNGGFMLISKKLADCAYAAKPLFTVATDVNLCRDARVYFERTCGAKYAPEEVGFNFSYEHGYQARKDAPPSFGYHDIFNWPLALDRDEVVRRIKMVLASPYVVGNTPKLAILAAEWPWVRDAVGQDFISAERAYQHPPRRARPIISSRARAPVLQVPPAPKPYTTRPVHPRSSRTIGYLTLAPGVKA